MFNFYSSRKDKVISDESSGLFLRKLIYQDIASVKKWLSDRELAYIAFGLNEDVTEEALKPNIDMYIKFMSSPHCPCNFYSICLADGTFVGLSKFDLRKMDYGLIGLAGLMIGEKNNRGRGIGSTAVYLIFKLMFDIFKVDIIEIETAVYNAAAIKCFKKAGMNECDHLYSLEGINDYGMPGFEAPKINMRMNKEDFLRLGGRLLTKRS